MMIDSTWADQAKENIREMCPKVDDIRRDIDGILTKLCGAETRGVCEIIQVGNSHYTTSKVGDFNFGFLSLYLGDWAGAGHGLVMWKRCPKCSEWLFSCFIQDDDYGLHTETFARLLNHFEPWDRHRCQSEIDADNEEWEQRRKQLGYRIGSIWDKVRDWLRE